MTWVFPCFQQMTGFGAFIRKPKFFPQKWVFPQNGCVSPDIISPGKHMAYGCPVWGTSSSHFLKETPKVIPMENHKLWHLEIKIANRFARVATLAAISQIRTAGARQRKTVKTIPTQWIFREQTRLLCEQTFMEPACGLKPKRGDSGAPTDYHMHQKWKKNGRKKTPPQHPDNDTGRNAWTANTWPSEIPIRTTIRYQSPTTISGGLATVYLLWIATSSTLLLSYSR